VRSRDTMFNQRGELFPTDSFTTLGVLLAFEESDGSWGIGVSARNVTDAVTADFAGPNPDPTMPAVAAPAVLRSVLISTWLRF